MKVYQKEFGCKAVAVSETDITPEMLAKINTFALKPLTAEDVYVRKFLLAHNAIDRDNERFPSPLLDQFAVTLPGKSFLFVHDRRSLPFGLWFDSSTEEVSPEEFKILTNIDPRMPDGQTSIRVQWAWSYMLNKDFNAQITENMDAGVYRHVSIGFNAADIIAVKKEANGPALYWEYVGPGEALEGSLVWLGAQPGATAQKTMKDQDNIKTEEHNMKGIIALLIGLGMKGLVDTATEDQVVAGIKTLIDEKNAHIADLETDAALGKSYKEKTVADYVALKHKLKEVGDDPEKHASMKAVAAGLPFSFLEAEVTSLQARVEKAFPDTGQLSGEDGNDKRDKAADEDNPLVPKEEK